MKRVPLCSEKECKHRSDPDWHIPWCGHGLEGHHHHVKKRSQGGKGGDVVFICLGCHRRIDENHWGNAVLNMPDGTRLYRVWDQKNKTVFDRVIGRWKGEEQCERIIEAAPESVQQNVQEIPIGVRHSAPVRDVQENVLPTVKEPTAKKPDVQYLPTSLVLPEGLSFGDWQELGGTLQGMVAAIPWWVGDWLNFGERKYGEKYSQGIQDRTGMKTQRLMNYAWVANAVETSTRVEVLSWSHHREVAPCPPETQRRLLTQAAKASLDVPDLKRLVRHEGIKALTSSESNEWYTPKKYIAAVRKVLGEIDLDPASHPMANDTVKAKGYFTLDDDGLEHDWRGRVFLNPPYGDLVAPFVNKAVGEYEAGHISEAIVLVNAHSTDASWFQGLFGYLLCFTDHRINFYNSADLEPSTGSTHGSVFIYLGSNEAKFADAFHQFGAVLKRYDYPR